MAYDSKKSKDRDSQADFTNAKKDLSSDVKQVGGESNQERGTGRGTRRVVVPVNKEGKMTYMSPAKNDAGNVVRIGPNTKGSDVLKDPLNTYKSTTKPAVENPAGSVDRASRRTAPGVRK